MPRKKLWLSRQTQVPRLTQEPKLSQDHQEPQLIQPSCWIRRGLAYRPSQLDHQTDLMVLLVWLQVRLRRKGQA